jgi:hypothetical protein
MIKEVAAATAARCYSRARKLLSDTWDDLETAFVNQIREELRAEIVLELAEYHQRRAEAHVTREVARFLRESTAQTGAGYAALLENGNWKNQARPNRAERHASAIETKLANETSGVAQKTPPKDWWA